jgi:hypothetical protein
MTSVNFNKIMGEDRSTYDLDRGITPTSVYSMINFQPSKKIGKIEISQGFSLVCDTGSHTAIQNMNIGQDNDENLKFTSISGGNIYDIGNWTSGATVTQKATGLKTSGFIDIIPSTKSDTTTGTSTSFLTILDGVLIPQKYDYDTLTALSSTTATQVASFGIYLNGKLWTNDVNEPALMHGSKAFTIDDFTGTDDAVFYQIGNNDNPVTCATSMFLPFYNTTNLIIAKNNELWAISGTTPDDFQVFRITEDEGGIGTQSPQGMIEVQGDLIILEDNIPRRYSTSIQQTGILKPQEIALPIKDAWGEDVNTDALKNGFVFFASKEGITGRIYNFVPNTIETCNEAFVFDRAGAWFRRKFYNYSFTAYAIDPTDHTVYVGDNVGRIFKLNDGYTYNGDNYRAFLDTGWTDFGVVESQKTGTPFSYIENDIYENTSFSLNIVKRARNGNITEATTKNFNLVRQEFQYDLAKYDESFYTDRTTVKSLFSLGSFHTCKLQLSLNNNGSNFTINSLVLDADAGVIL